MSKPNGDPAPSNREARIACRAYAIWEERGRPDGLDLDHWLQAEREAMVEGPPPRSRRRRLATEAA
jgi:hypothetical protein